MNARWCFLAVALAATLGTAAQAETLWLDRQPGEPLQRALMRARIEARQGSRTAPHATQPSDVVRPFITAGKILTPNLSTERPPAAPALQLRYDTNGVGLGAIYAELVSPSGKQVLMLGSSFAPGQRPNSGEIVLQQPAGFSGGDSTLPDSQGALTFYSERGVWSVAALTIDDSAGNGLGYDAAATASLLKVSTFYVSNPDTPDTRSPKVQGGRVFTKSISTGSASPYFRCSLTASDTASGINYVGFVLQAPSGSFPSSLFALSALTSPLASGDIRIDGDLRGAPAGTWKIFSYFACDVAGNCLEDFTPADVQALLGTTSFQVTP